MRIIRLRKPGQKPTRRKTVLLAKYFLVILISLGVLAPVLCNEKPIYVRYHGVSMFPALSIKGYADVKNPVTGKSERLVYSLTDWKYLQKESVIWSPIPFSPGKSDWSSINYKPPFSKSENPGDTLSSTPAHGKHWLGTTKTGADLLSGLIHGIRISVSIGIFSMLIAGFIGITAGSVAGFLGNSKVKISRAGIWVSLLAGLPLSYYYSFYLNRFLLKGLLSENILAFSLFCFFILLIMISVIFLFYAIGKWLGNSTGFKKRVFLKADGFMLLTFEIFASIPKIILIVSLSAIARPSILNLILIIGFSSWVEIARLVRAEMLRIRESEYIHSATAHGVPMIKIVFIHALPNALGSAFVAITFGVASAILIESSLSFLGIGVPSDIVTWGSLLSEGKENFEAWWLVIFPGLAIYATLTSLNILGDSLSSRLLPKRK